jgi:periodic tryptophan protein 2
MQVDFRLASVHGMLYTGGNVAFGPAPSATSLVTSGMTPIGKNSLITPVLNYLTVLDLQHGSTRTHECCNSNIQAFDVSPDGEMALCIGTRGLGVFYSFTAELAIDTISFPPLCEVRCVKFSPDGTHVALALENTLQIYSCPRERIVSYHGCHRVENIHNAMTLPITNIEWTDDSSCVMISGADSRISIFPRDVRNRKGVAAMRNHLLGHRGSVVGCYWSNPSGSAAVSVSTDNVVITWKRTGTTRSELMEAVIRTKAGVRVADVDGATDDEDAVPQSFLEKQKRRELRRTLEQDGVAAYAKKRVTKGTDSEFPDVIKYAFEVGKKHLLQHRGTVSRSAYHRARQLLAIGYNNGVFAIHGLESESGDLPLLHMLSISSQALTACAFSASGDHVAFGSDHLKQLIVWDWRGESYLLKEQSHYYDINVTGVTSDGSTIISGGEDGKVKVWKRSNGQCFANFSDHSGGVTGLVCSPHTNAFFTASKDGTCRGYDLTRYRNFRVFTPTETTQLSCVAIDASGEIIAAGSSRTNVITLWSVRTGKIIDEFTGHEGPVAALQFHPDGTTLVTAAVDKTIMVWKVFSTTNEGERLRDEAEVIQVETEALSLSFSSNGKRLAVLFLDGTVNVYDSTVSTELNFVSSFKTKFDAAGGWAGKIGPNIANANAHFTSVSMSPDGETILCGGDSKWLCLYHAAQGYLMNKWPVTRNMDFEGAEEQFNYRGVTEAGVQVGDIDVSNDDPHLQKRKVIEMPGSKHAHFATGKRKTKLTARSMHVAFAGHGRDFIAATTGGLLVFSVDAGRQKFAPLQLRANVTTQVVRQLLESGQYTSALVGSLMLQDEDLGAECLRRTPLDKIAVIVPSMPSAGFATLVQWVAKEVIASSGLDHALAWADATLIATEEPVFGHARLPAVATAIRLLHRAVAMHRSLAALTDGNDFLVGYVLTSTRCAKTATSTAITTTSNHTTNGHAKQQAAPSVSVAAPAPDEASPKDAKRRRKQQE